MVTAAWDTSNLVALYKDGLQCTSCCGVTPPYPTEPDLCCPGFGTGLTPSQYTVKIEGVVDCPGFAGDATLVNGTWVLDLNDCAEPVEEPSCTWSYIEAEEDGSVKITIHRLKTTGCTEIYVTGWIWRFLNGFWGWIPVFSSLDGYTHTTGWCDTVDSRWLACGGFLSLEGYSGTAKFWPGGWPQWVITTTYFVNDLVENGADIYECLVEHVASALNEPGSGVDWMSYWQVADPCGDENVACP